MCLISLFERRDGFVFSFVKSVGNYVLVFEFDVGRVGIVLERKGMFYLFFIRDYILVWICNRVIENDMIYLLCFG